MNKRALDYEKGKRNGTGRKGNEKREQEERKGCRVGIGNEDRSNYTAPISE